MPTARCRSLGKKRSALEKQTETCWSLRYARMMSRGCRKQQPSEGLNGTEANMLTVYHWSLWRWSPVSRIFRVPMLMHVLHQQRLLSKHAAGGSFRKPGLDLPGIRRKNHVFNVFDMKTYRYVGGSFPLILSTRTSTFLAGNVLTVATLKVHPKHHPYLAGRCP